MLLTSTLRNVLHPLLKHLFRESEKKRKKNVLNNEHMQIKGILLPEIMYFSKFYLGSGIDLTGATRQDIGVPVQKSWGQMCWAL